MTEADGPIVIFGAAGQDGQYLTGYHRERGERVLGFSRRAGPGVDALDVSEGGGVAELVRATRPRILYQLAAASTTRHDALWANHAAIATGTLNVLEAALAHSPSTRVVVIGSALQFENRGEPIRETDPFAATSPYAVARIHAAFAARYYRSRGLRAYVGYLFHHESPLRRLSHLSARICADVAAIARGEGAAGSIEVGDSSVEKEWGFAGDVAVGLATLAGQDEIFEAVVGTGTAYSVATWIERCFAYVGISPAGRVREIPGFKAEYPRIVSSPDTLRGLGWAPRIELDELVAMMMRNALEVSEPRLP
jgi:GDPmannose 4,6-dehydratase